MNDQWNELKETIIELRDNNGTATQQEVCKFLVNYMNVLEKQMKKDSEERLKKLEAELEYAKFRCALPTIMDMMRVK